MKCLNCLVGAGLIVFSAFIFPFRAERRVVRDLVEDGEFIGIYECTNYYL